MGRLEDRVVHTSHPHIKGYVRQTGQAEYQWTLKNHDVPDDEPPQIWMSGKASDPDQAFKDLYHSVDHHNLTVVNKGNDTYQQPLF